MGNGQCGANARQAYKCLKRHKQNTEYSWREREWGQKAKISQKSRLKSMHACLALPQIHAGHGGIYPFEIFIVRRGEKEGRMGKECPPRLLARLLPPPAPACPLPAAVRPEGQVRPPAIICHFIYLFVSSFHFVIWGSEESEEMMACCSNHATAYHPHMPFTFCFAC